MGLGESPLEGLEMNWEDRNVLLTGASGLVGSWLAESLVGKGANVTILLRDYVPSSHLFENGIWSRTNTVRGELEDYALVERAINEYEIDSIFHMAAQTIVGTANRSPLSTFKSNIEGTWNVLEAARASGLVKSVVVASSDKAYGSHEKLPYTEDMALEGRHPYDVSKSCADLLAQSYFHTYKLPVAIARCGNIYGPGDLNFNRLIPGTIRSILRGEEFLIRSDGTYVRDYIFVKDVADAYLTLAENMDKPGVKGEAFNFSVANKITVLQLVELIAKAMGIKCRPKILNTAKGEIRNQYLSSAKAGKVLGWKAKYQIEKGIGETIPWYREYFKGRPRPQKFSD